MALKMPLTLVANLRKPCLTSLPVFFEVSAIDLPRSLAPSLILVSSNLRLTAVLERLKNAPTFLSGSSLSYPAVVIPDLVE